MSPTGPRGLQGHRAGQGAERSQGSMHREVSMHESRPEQQQRIKLFATHRGSDCRICVDYTSIYYCCKSFPVLLHDVMVGK